MCYNYWLPKPLANSTTTGSPRSPITPCAAYRCSHLDAVYDQFFSPISKLNDSDVPKILLCWVRWTYLKVTRRYNVYKFIYKSNHQLLQISYNT